ncbi:hypothetical protein LQZ18_18590 [Lachnospiraceae bacterium ZAX-1]
MAKYKKISALLLFMVGALVSIAGLISNFYGVSNRYGSVITHKNDVYYYANCNIYQYTPDRQLTLVEKNVAPSFTYHNGMIYYVIDDKIVCMELDTKQRKFSFRIESMKKDTFTIHVYHETLVVEHDVYKKPENAKLYYFDLSTGEPVDADFKLEAEDLPHESPVDEYEKFIDGYMTGCSLAENDILYARFPYGKSYLSSYHAIRDEAGNVAKMELVEAVLPFSDKEGFSWNLQAVIQIIICPVACFATGMIVLSKKSNKDKRRKQDS